MSSFPRNRDESHPVYKPVYASYNQLLGFCYKQLEYQVALELARQLRDFSQAFNQRFACRAQFFT